MIYAFDGYELDTDRFELRCAGQAIDIEPQVLQLLAYLIANRRRVVAKAELIEHLWPQHIVSDNALHQRIATARRLLGDRSRQPTCIRTIRGKGYHFIASVEETTPQRLREALSLPLRLESSASPRSSAPSFMVGRAAELTVLQQCWEAACEGERRMVWVTGEAGIGKTTLVNAFTHRIAADRPLRLGHGQCVDQYGPGEAYMPILAALERLGRGDHGAELAACLGQYAPSWLIQLPSLLTADRRDRLQRQAAATTQARMLRELLYALEQFALDAPIMLVLEDLHWSDPSTLALLAALARRTEPARLMIIGTYRLTEARRHRAELATLAHELQLHGQCVELELTAFSEDAVYDYLATRFTGLIGLTDLTRVAYQRTEGHPLFLATVVNNWIARGWLQENRWGWRLQAADQGWEQAIPLSLQRMIRHQVEQMTPDQQELLAIASVIGDVFSPEAVAACRDTDLLTEEANCKALEQYSPFIHRQDEQNWPDGALSSGYAFAHALYRDVIYAHAPSAQRVAWHCRLAARLEQAYQTNLDEVAAQLAIHCERGRLYSEAIAHHQRAAQHTLTRTGVQEAYHHLARALELLEMLSDPSTRIQRELGIQIQLGPVLMALKGYAAPEVEQVYTRAHQLCQQLPYTPYWLPALWGLWMVYNVRAELQAACDYGENLLELAQAQQGAADLLRAHRGLGTTLMFRGQYLHAHTHLQQACAQYNTMQQDDETDHYSFDHGSSTHSFMARNLWCLGYADQALAHNRTAMALAQSRAHPHTLVNTQLFTAVLHQHRREGEAMRQWAEAALRLAQQQGIALRIAHGLLYRGCGLSMTGELEVGIRAMQQGLDAVRATGAALAWSWFLSMLAEAYRQAGRTAEGLRVIDEALTHANQTGEYFWLAELYRLRGELRLASASSDHQEAASCFEQALNVARQQQARFFELRAAVSLSRLWQEKRRIKAAYELLSPIYNWFTEGFDTADLVDASVLLSELSQSASTSNSAPACRQRS